MKTESKLETLQGIVFLIQIWLHFETGSCFQMINHILDFAPEHSPEPGFSHPPKYGLQLWSPVWIIFIVFCPFQFLYIFWKFLVNKTDLLALYLSRTYCHKTSTRPPSCVTPRQLTIYSVWLSLDMGPFFPLKCSFHPWFCSIQLVTPALKFSIFWRSSKLFFMVERGLI